MRISKRIFKLFFPREIMIKITFLGTADSIPSVNRNHSAILITYSGENILVDCGEGTQRQFRKAGLNPCKISKILITHIHGDHILGLPGLLKTLAMSGYNKKLEIYGPRGIKFFLKDLFKLFSMGNEFPIEVKEVEGVFFENPDFYLESKKMDHNVPCNAYSFVKKSQIRIDKEKLSKSKIPPGKHLLELKQGKNIQYNGKKYLLKDLTFKEEDKKITIILDTGLNSNSNILAKNSDILICDSSFGEDFKDKAKEHKHLTAGEAAGIAKKSKSKKLILTHISQRYDRRRKNILDEAKKIFKNSILVNDLDVLEL